MITRLLKILESKLGLYFSSNSFNLYTSPFKMPVVPWNILEHLTPVNPDPFRGGGDLISLSVSL